MSGDKPLEGWHILLTRSQEDNALLRVALEERGATVLELPTVSVLPPDDFSRLDNALANLEGYDWIAFSSRHAVRRVLERMKSKQLPLGHLLSLRIAAVGAATAAELAIEGIRADCVPAEPTAQNLAAAMRKEGITGLRILAPQGDLSRAELKEGLEEGGALVETVIVYRTARPSDVDSSALSALEQGLVDVVVVASPSAIRNLAEMLGPETLKKPEFVCIGRTTADETRNLGFAVAVVAESSTTAGIVKAIEDLGSGVSESEKRGVLLMAYGTPDTLDNVEPYYTHIRGGRKPSPELVQELRERYELVGGTTPLLEITEKTRRALEERLNESEYRFRVILGMKHWHPYIEQAVDEMTREGLRTAVGLVLAPHYSSMSIAGYYNYFDAAQKKLGTDIELDRIESWHLHQPYLNAVARRVRERLEEFPPGEPITVIFTAHSLPERILEQDDPYPQQLRETSEALAKMLRLTEIAGEFSATAPSGPTWTFSYQSAGRTPEPWLGPDLPDKVEELAQGGVTNILVASIGFVSDHLEILYDIDYEAQQAARERGITLKRTEMLNASPDFVEGLAELVLEKVARS